MMTKGKLLILFAVVAVMLMLVTTAEAKRKKPVELPPNYLCQDGDIIPPQPNPPGCVPCSPAELELGTCTPITDRAGTFTGYIARISDGYPMFNGETDTTTTQYESCVVAAYCPKTTSHVDLESPLCETVDCGFQSATANGFDCEPKTPADCAANSDTGLLPNCCFEEFSAGEGGDPSSGFLQWAPSGLFKIHFFYDPKIWVYTVSFEVYGEAYQTLGNIGIKAGLEMLTGKILVPVCDASCGLVSFAAATGTEDNPVTVETDNGYKFDMTCDGSTGCCEVTMCYDNEGNEKQCNKVPIGEFFETTEGDSITDWASEGCLNLIVDDDSDHSPSYCSGGWCWY